MIADCPLRVGLLDEEHKNDLNENGSNQKLGEKESNKESNEELNEELNKESNKSDVLNDLTKNSKEKNNETLPPSVEPDEKQNSKGAAKKTTAEDSNDKPVSEADSKECSASKAHSLNRTTKNLINYKKLTKKIKKRQTSTSSLSSNSFSSASSETSSSSISSKSVSPCSFSYQNQQTNYPPGDYYVDNSPQDSVYPMSSHFAGNAHTLNGQINGQWTSNQMMYNQPVESQFLDDQTRTGYIPNEFNHFPEANNYSYYGQSMESYLPPPASTYLTSQNYQTGGLPLFRSTVPPSSNSLSALKVCPGPYDYNEIYADNLAQQSLDAEYLNYFNSTPYQPNNPFLCPVPSQTSPMLQSSINNASYNRPIWPAAYPVGHLIRSDQFSSFGDRPSFSHQMSNVDHSFDHHLEHPINQIYHKASHSECPLTCENGLQIGHYTCRNRSQQCENYRQFDCHLHRGCCVSSSPKACSNSCNCRIMSCPNEPFESQSNYIKSNCSHSTGHDCSSRCCSHNYYSHCDTVHSNDYHRKACHRHHEADLKICKPPRNCPCLQDNLIVNQLNSSVNFTGTCPNQSTNCEMQKASTKKALDQFETDSGIATRCNSTANGSLEIE